ncbi:MAG: Na(+)/H(+) antiporter subunit D [Deltaproteobacteria bacterium]|nr:Na(+)/H(+) antiporter subunit D [Deltaproteobacteria bacterium]
MINPIPPGLIFILGALLLPLFKGRFKQAYLFLLALLGFIDLCLLKMGTHWVIRFLNYDLILLKVDRLSLAMGIIFIVIGLFAILYSLHVKEDGQHVAALIYMGSSLGVVFSGDYFSLFFFWEIMAVASTFLIWYRREKLSLDAGFRYLFMHILGGCALLTGITLHVVSTGSIAVQPLASSLASSLILIGFGLNAAFLLLHTWLPDAYPEGTMTGSVFLSVFTTKTGIYALARCFTGNEFIAYMGGAMAIFGVVYALLQNDVRRLISYHIISQVGYMVAGIGVGTVLSVNGGIAHLINNLLYKTLLFMCMGSVIQMTGKRKLTDLGGLAGKMPVTCITCVIASLSISGAPGFNGFVSKGMLISSMAEAHQPLLEWMLRLASVGTFLSFTKLCAFTFFSKNDRIEAKEAPLNMTLAMIIIASLSILVGIYPKILFSILPHAPADYHAYTLSHIIGVFQLFLWAGLVFMLARTAFSPHSWIILDFDYFYRMVFQWMGGFFKGPLNDLRLRMQARSSRAVNDLVHLSRNPFGLLEKTRGRKEIPYDEDLYRKPMGLGVLLAILLLFLYGLIYLIKS